MPSKQPSPAAASRGLRGRGATQGLEVSNSDHRLFRGGSSCRPAQEVTFSNMTKRFKTDVQSWMEKERSKMKSSTSSIIMSPRSRVLPRAPPGPMDPAPGAALSEPVPEVVPAEPSPGGVPTEPGESAQPDADEVRRF